jgi:hypothetical protein
MLFTQKTKKSSYLPSKKVSALGWATAGPKSRESDWGKRLNEPMPFMHRLLNPSGKAIRNDEMWSNTFIGNDDPNYLGWAAVLSGKQHSSLLYLLMCDALVRTHCEKAMDQLIHSTRID